MLYLVARELLVDRATNLGNAAIDRVWEPTAGRLLSSPEALLAVTVSGLLGQAWLTRHQRPRQHVARVARGRGYQLMPPDMPVVASSGPHGLPGAWSEIGIAQQDLLITSVELEHGDPHWTIAVTGDLGVGGGGGEQITNPVASTGSLPYPIEVKAGERIAVRVRIAGGAQPQPINVRARYLNASDVG